MTFSYFPAPVLSLGFQQVNLTFYSAGGDLSFRFQAKHTQEGSQTWGVNGESGALVDMKDLGIWEPLAVKLQTYKTAVEVRRGGDRTSEPPGVVSWEGGNVTGRALGCLRRLPPARCVCDDEGRSTRGSPGSGFPRG